MYDAVRNNIARVVRQDTAAHVHLGCRTFMPMTDGDDEDLMGLENS